MKRAAGILKANRSADAAERLDEFLSNEELEGDARTSNERAMLANVLRMRDLRVVDVMVPRADIVAIDAAASLEETLKAFSEGAHSRLPVYRETLDDPLGVVHLKDIALSHGFGARTNDFALAEHLRSVLAVPPSMPILSLLQRMQATRRHMALVIDEYGGVDGLVTIEDVIEQIVGEIEDEHDDAERPLWIRQADGAYLAEARAFVEEFEEATGLKLALDEWGEDVDTLGGLVFVLTGRVPARGEVVAHPLGVEFEIVDADPRRIKRVRVRPNDGADQAAARREDRSDRAGRDASKPSTTSSGAADDAEAQSAAAPATPQGDASENRTSDDEASSDEARDDPALQDPSSSNGAAARRRGAATLTVVSSEVGALGDRASGGSQEGSTAAADR